MELTIPLFQVKSSNCEPLWGDGRKDKIKFDDKQHVFSTFRHSTIFGFSDLEIGEIIENIWKNKCGLKIPLSEAKLSFDTPKGVMTARNKSNSTKQNAFSTCRHSTILLFFVKKQNC